MRELTRVLRSSGTCSNDGEVVNGCGRAHPTQQSPAHLHSFFHSSLLRGRVRNRQLISWRRSVHDEEIPVLGKDWKGNPMTIKISRNALGIFPVFQRFFLSHYYYPKMGVQLWLLGECRGVDVFHSVVTLAGNPALIDSVLGSLARQHPTNRFSIATLYHMWAVRLQQTRIRGPVVEWLRDQQHLMSLTEVKIIAIAAYFNPDEPNELREWFRVLVPTWLRQLLADPDCQDAMHRVRPALVVDLWRWAGAALLTGEWPYDGMPRIVSNLPDIPVAQQHERLCGTVVWNARPGCLRHSVGEEERLRAGDRLIDCYVHGQDIHGWTATDPPTLKAIHRDGIRLFVELKETDSESPITSAENGMPQGRASPTQLGTADVNTAATDEDMDPPNSARSTGNLNKASRILGLETGSGDANGTPMSTTANTPIDTPQRERSQLDRKRKKPKVESNSSSPVLGHASASASTPIKTENIPIDTENVPVKTENAPTDTEDVPIKKENVSPTRGIANFIGHRLNPSRGSGKDFKG